MNIVSTINQSFHQVFQSIGRGIKHVFQATHKIIEQIGKLTMRLHGLITTAIQLLINLASVMFVVFVPFGFFLDPLDWSGKLGQYADPELVFWVRMALGAFFAYVVFLLMASLWKTLRDTSNSSEDEEKANKKGFIRFISSLLSWLLIACVFVYFTLFRLRLFGFEPELLGIHTDPWRWLQGVTGRGP